MNTDLQLLSRYARTRDAEAFTQLVRRHGVMVFAAARRVTEDHHDAEEVAQNCFLDLSRQAASIEGSVAGWLHSVATRRAAMYNRQAGRRRKRERQVAQLKSVVVTEAPWEDIAPLVDAALAELPEEWRLPVVLYYLEGRSQSEVAAELGVNQSTVSRRLEAGVAALREKLQAAGVEASYAVLPALLAQHATIAVPKTLVAALGKLAVSGLVPTTSTTTATAGAASAGAGISSGGTVTAGASSLAAKGSVALGVKVTAALVLTAVVSTAGIVLLPRQRAAIATAVATDTSDMSPEARDVLARLKAEIARGTGDGVGIVAGTELDLDHPKPAPPMPVVLELFAKQGPSQLYLYYYSDRKRGWGNPNVKLPRGWPTPDLDETLRFADTLRTNLLQVTDGYRYWRTQRKDNRTTFISSPVEGNPQGDLNIRSALEIPWSPLSRINDDAHPMHLEVLHRPDNPALLGLHLTGYAPASAGKIAHKLISDETYWVDPGRNYIPVEAEIQVYNGHPKVQRTGKAEYLDYAQLPDGRWYISHERIHWDRGWNCVDNCLTFIPGNTLDAKWFSDPTSRLADDVKTGKIAPAKDIAVASHAITTAAATVAKSNWWPWLLAVLMFGSAGVLLILQRRKASAQSPLQGFKGSRRK